MIMRFSDWSSDSTQRPQNNVILRGASRHKRCLSGINVLRYTTMPTGFYGEAHGGDAMPREPTSHVLRVCGLLCGMHEEQTQPSGLLNTNTWVQCPSTSTRILGRRSPFPPFLILNRVPHGVLPKVL